jgi:hypothetical protein
MVKTLYRLVAAGAVLVGLICQSAAPLAAGSAHTLTVSPVTAEVMAGGVARFEIAAIPNATDQLRSVLRWRVDGLPKDSTAEFMLDWGDPIDGPVIIRTASGLRPGKYPLTVVASTASERWIGRVTLNVTACQETDAAGRFTRNGDDHAVGRRQGGPSTLAYSIGSSALVFCEGTAKRKLHIALQAASDERGKSLAKVPGGMILYRFLQYPPDTGFILAGRNQAPTVEEVAATGFTALDWDIQPGVYLLYFPQEQFVRRLSLPQKYPQISVTYQLEILKSKD